MSGPEVSQAARAVADEVALHVAELSDRNSPDDWPEAMLVTADELRDIVVDVLTRHQSTAPLFEALEQAREALEDARPVLSRAAKAAHRSRIICGHNTSQEREAIEASQAVSAALASIAAAGGA
jgi:hypothetical protein